MSTCHTSHVTRLRSTNGCVTVNHSVCCLSHTTPAKAACVCQCTGLGGIVPQSATAGAAMWFTSFSFVGQEFIVRVADLAQARSKKALEDCSRDLRRTDTPLHAFVGSGVPAETTGGRGRGFDNNPISHGEQLGSF